MPLCESKTNAERHTILDIPNGVTFRIGLREPEPPEPRAATTFVRRQKLFFGI
jgi:hypothetical protein